MVLVAAALVLTGCGDDGDTSSDAERPEAGPRRDQREVDPDVADELRALGYAGVGAPLALDAEVGVVAHDPQRAGTGLNLFTNAHLCRTELMDMKGEVLHAWTHAPCFRWGNAVVTPEGDLLVVGRSPHDGTPAAAKAGRYLTRLAWDGSLLWQKRLPVHHDVELTPDGRVLTLTYGLRPVPELDASVPLIDNSLVLLSGDGEILEELSLWDVMNAAPDVFTPQPVAPGSFDRARGVDALHANSIEWLRHSALVGRGLEHGDDAVLVCFRNQDIVAIIDWSERRPVWAWGRGEISGPHDATLLDDGNVLLFDNGLGRGWSRVIEVDPIRDAIVWEYRAPDPTSFFTITRGSNQRLANGNTLIADSDSGTAIEVTPAGEVVWRFQNFNLTERREPSVIVRMRRFEGIGYTELLQQVAAEQLGFVD